MMWIALASGWVLSGLVAYVLAVGAERSVIGEVPAGSWAMFLTCLAAGPFCFVYVFIQAVKMYRGGDDA